MLAAEQLLLFVGCLALLAFLMGFGQLLTSRKLKRELNDLRAQLDSQRPQEVTEQVNFSASLAAVEKQHLQSPAQAVPRNSAEKYRYVGSLADQGLDAEGIAKALQMPATEVEQLLRLAKLKQASGTQ